MMLKDVQFIDGRAVLEASELRWKPYHYAASFDLPRIGRFVLSQIDKSPDGDTFGWIYKCGKLSITVVND